MAWSVESSEIGECMGDNEISHIAAVSCGALTSPIRVLSIEVTTQQERERRVGGAESGEGGGEGEMIAWCGAWVKVHTSDE
jgi:hypothetical protein